MIAICILLIATVAIARGASQCDGVHSCARCASTPGCGWCAASRLCLAGNTAGPTEQNVYCQGRGAWNFGQCPSCDTFSNDCRACTLGNHDCAWCEKSSKCVAWDDDASCPTGMRQTCPCSEYASCATCTTFSDGECGWCHSSDSCEKTQGSTCAIKLTCPCEDNSNCDSCLDDFNGHHDNKCSWCAETGKCSDQGSSTCRTAALSCPAACDTYTSKGCQACQDAGCGWCGDSNKCVDFENPTCLVAHTCPEDNCAKFGSCDTCNQRSAAGCGWCKKDGKDQCVNVNNGECKTGLLQHSCELLCEAKTTCGDCHAQEGCGWCKSGESRSCVDTAISVKPCLVDYTCSESPGNSTGTPSSGGKTGSFFLGMFVLAAVLGVALGAYYLYQRRQGRPLYTSI